MGGVEMQVVTYRTGWLSSHQSLPLRRTLWNTVDREKLSEIKSSPSTQY